MTDIDHNVPLPGKRRQSNTRYPFGDMQVKDSFAVPAEEARRMGVAASVYKRRHPGWDYLTRSQPDGSLRLWRTT